MATTRKPASRRRTPVRARSRGAAAPRDDLDARLAKLRASIAVLEQAVDALERMPKADVDALPIDARQQRARAIGDALLSVQRLRNAQLRALNEAFEARARKLEVATQRLATTLGSLREGSDFVAAAAAAIAAIANLVLTTG